MKTSKDPMTIAIKAHNVDRKDYTEARLVYFFSERRRLGPKDKGWKAKLLADGYHEVGRQHLRNGKMILVRNARVVVEVYEYRSPRVRVYQTDITDQMRKLVGAKDASPDAVYRLKSLIDCKKVAVVLAEGEVSVNKI